MIKLISAISIFAGICLVAACTKTQNYGGTAVQKAWKHANISPWYTMRRRSNGVRITMPGSDFSVLT